MKSRLAPTEIPAAAPFPTYHVRRSPRRAKINEKMSFDQLLNAIKENVDPSMAKFYSNALREQVVVEKTWVVKNLDVAVANDTDDDKIGDPSSTYKIGLLTKKERQVDETND